MNTEHPLQKFRFCPVCGSPHFEVNNFKSKKCHSCGFTYYANPCSATAAFIVAPLTSHLSPLTSIQEELSLLVVRRAKEPAKGTLDLPGGFVDMGETVEEGMRREIKEETSIDVYHIEYLFSSPNVYMYSGMGVHTLDMDFLVRLPSQVKVHAADDADECLWIPLSEVNPDDFGLTSIRNAVIRFLKEVAPFLNANH